MNVEVTDKYSLRVSGLKYLSDWNAEVLELILHRM